MIFFPDWSDLGLGHLSPDTQNTWEHQLMLLERYRYYFDGDVFEERVETDAGSREDAPLLFPVQINLVKMLALAQADAIFGEADESEQPVLFAVRGDKPVSTADAAAIDLCNDILFNSGASTLWEIELDRNVFGGGAFKVEPDLQKPGHVRWSRIHRNSFFPIWDPDQPDELLEAYMVVYMTREQAKAKYGFEGENPIVQRVEHWTRWTYTNHLDGVELRDLSGINPWGVVPFVYIPRFRFHNWWGESLAKDIVGPQDELNMRVADIGEAINYNAHPIRWGLNLPRNFNAENFPLTSNAMWDLGRSLGNNPPPQVGMLEAKVAVSPAAFDYVQFIYDWSRTSVFAPPIAFGEDNGGGQRSGATLEIRMWPLIKSARRSRTYLARGISQALQISARILQQKELPGVSRRAIQAILDGNVVPRFHEVLPRDHAAIVDEVVKLLSTHPPSISLETAQSILGRGTGEVGRIREMLADDELWGRLEKMRAQAQEQQQEGQPEQQPQEDEAVD